LAWKQHGEHFAQPSAGFVVAKTEAKAAARLFEALRRIVHRTGVWWACHKRPCYAELLNWYLDLDRAEENGGVADTMAERIAACYYEVGLYAKWEETRKGLGPTTTRDIEKAIRWDGMTYSCAGKGYEIISAYVATSSVKAPKQ
jgi:hypothetical protein